MLHSAFLIGVGWWGAYSIITKMQYWEKLYNSGNYNPPVPIQRGWKCLLFGVLYGTVTYLAGNVTKGTTEAIMLMLGFNEHTGPSPDGETITTTTTTATGITTTNVINTSNEAISYDYEKLIELQDNWANFFSVQRGVQILAPYILLACVEIAVGGVIGLTIQYI
jgi:hypothetical protein